MGVTDFDCKANEAVELLLRRKMVKKQAPVMNYKRFKYTS